MKYLLFISILFSLFSCASKTPVKEVSNQSEGGFQGQVLIEGDDGVRRPMKMTGAKEKTIYDPASKKAVTSGGWVNIKSGDRPGKYLANKTVRQLMVLAKQASPREATLIIDELLVRKEQSVPALASFLTDSRAAVFVKNREYWWYEKKGVSPEVVELRVYAAYALQNKTAVNPEGVLLALTKDNMFFATRGDYAVVKDDVAKVWNEWWSLAQNDY